MNGTKYQRSQQTAGQPTVEVDYDECGREICRTTDEPGEMLSRESRDYDSKGNVISIIREKGFLPNFSLLRINSNIYQNLSITENLTYDSRHRLASDTWSTGKSTTYSYGNRSVTSACNGHVASKTFDAWGNVKTSTDSLNTVSYTYYSSGLPHTVSCGGSTITMEYDEAGNRTLIDDPDAGEITATWSADGKILTQTDAKGIATTYSYTALGCVDSIRIGSKTIVNTYGTLSPLRLQSTSMDGNTISYTYDNYNRITHETRTFSDNTVQSYSYTYNSNNLLSQAVYPNGISVGYQYDDRGYLTDMEVNGQNVWKRLFTDGRKDSTLLCGTISCTSLLDANGNLSSQKWRKGTWTIRHKNYSFDGATNNLSSRSVSVPVLSPLNQTNAQTMRRCQDRMLLILVL